LTYPKFPEPITGQYIPRDAFDAILAHVDAGPKRALFELAYVTGVRKGQLRKTELKNVHRTERGTVTVLVWDAPNVKNRREHVVPLEGRAQTIVQELWKGRRPGCGLFHLDGRPMGDLRSEWRRASTNFAAVGVPDGVARSITGHRTASMHMRYNITQESAQRAALAAVDRLVEAGRG
jgi:integrase